MNQDAGEFIRSQRSGSISRESEADQELTSDFLGSMPSRKTHQRTTNLEPRLYARISFGLFKITHKSRVISTYSRMTRQDAGR
jgi:hypothetical protein